MRRFAMVWAATAATLVVGCAADRPAADRPVEREAINSRAPDLPYSEAVRAGDTYHFAGRIGVTAETRAMGEGRAAAETRNVMEGFRGLFDQVGIGFEDIVSGTVYLTDMADYDAMNRVYAEYFPTDPPARVTVGVASLPAGAVVEISFIGVAR